MKLKLFLMISLFPLLCQAQVVKGFKRTADKVNITLSDGTLSISPLSENAVRIKFYKESEMNLPELVLTSGVATPGFQVLDLPTKLEIKQKIFKCYWISIQANYRMPIMPAKYF
jgi:hypothetical protein